LRVLKWPLVSCPRGFLPYWMRCGKVSASMGGGTNRLGQT
jgi:hypothetical protein